VRVDAVVFDWGGTLTPWHDVDLVAQWYAYAEVYRPERARELAERLYHEEESRWRVQRDSAGARGTGALEHVFAAVGIDTTSPLHTRALQAYLDFWSPHTYADPDAAPLLRALRDRGIRIGVLSNTMWPRAHHEEVFERDGLRSLIDAAVYTSELPVGKPHADAFRVALDAVGVREAGAAVFVGDRAWDDVHGAQQVGMRAILVPHSRIPDHQRGAVEGRPDAVVSRLGEVLDVVDAWNGVGGPSIP
jgi:HAD superfamily hydrolase (TIGR01509 family)